MKGFGMLDTCLLPTRCLGPCGLGTCIVDPIGNGINDDDTCIVAFSLVSVAFAFRESTLRLLPTLDSPTAVHLNFFMKVT